MTITTHQCKYHSTPQAKRWSVFGDLTRAFHKRTFLQSSWTKLHSRELGARKSRKSELFRNMVGILVDVLLYVALLCNIAKAEDTTVSVSVGGFNPQDASFVVDIGGTQWLKSGTMRAFVDDTWHSVADGGILPTKSNAVSVPYHTSLLLTETYLSRWALEIGLCLWPSSRVGTD